ncbi:hypothetical protein OPT61_g1460 [Boeremia exigua]|uniref:Uncharacterized protein n=1 Tax=Boeremia exigua TaxID=749465 RepID=A0ACC2IQ90_9PLEO|nr:hypothetical protein OPT61_g1460 [Boeremia exigua]
MLLRPASHTALNDLPVTIMAVDYFADPPPGLDLTESRTASNNAVGIVLFVLSAVFVGLRLLTRLRLKREKLGLDDYLMFLGLALNAGNLACCIAGGFFGLGKHIWSLDAYQMRQITIVKTITHEVHSLVLTMSADHIRWYGTDGVVQVDEAKFYLGVGIINLFGDICILTVPVSSVINLRLARNQKIAISLIFLLGSFVCFASMYRIITITRLVRTTDISWAKSDVFIWSSVEPSIGIISGCLPTLRPLLLHTMQSWFNLKLSACSSSGKASHSITLEPIETIGKKRTRKISIQDTLADSQFTEIVDDSDAQGGKQGQHSRAWRPDEDEMCLTTTTVHAHGESRTGTGRGSPEAQESAGISVTKEFDWGETTRR